MSKKTKKIILGMTITFMVMVAIDYIFPKPYHDPLIRLVESLLTVCAVGVMLFFYKNRIETKQKRNNTKTTPPEDKRRSVSGKVK